MAAFKRSPLRLGHKPPGRQLPRPRGNVFRRMIDTPSVPTPRTEFSGWKGRRASVIPAALRNLQSQPTAPRRGDVSQFNTLGLPSF